MLTCSCPTRDGIACLQMRYGLNLDEALLEPCDCSCHLKENQHDPVYEWEEELTQTEWEYRYMPVWVTPTQKGDDDDRSDWYGAYWGPEYQGDQS